MVEQGVLVECSKLADVTRRCREPAHGIGGQRSVGARLDTYRSILHASAPAVRSSKQHFQPDTPARTMRRGGIMRAARKHAQGKRWREATHGGGLMKSRWRFGARDNRQALPRHSARDVRYRTSTSPPACSSRGGTITVRSLESRRASVVRFIFLILFNPT